MLKGGGGEEASCLNTFNQHGKQNLTRSELKTLTHHGTRVARSTGAALVVDWGVPLCCWDRRSRLHVLIMDKLKKEINSCEGVRMAVNVGLILFFAYLSRRFWRVWWAQWRQGCQAGGAPTLAAILPGRWPIGRSGPTPKEKTTYLESF